MSKQSKPLPPEAASVSPGDPWAKVKGWTPSAIGMLYMGQATEFYRADAVDAARASDAARIQELEAQIEDFWTEVARGYDIENRQEINTGAAFLGMTPIQHAMHLIWKRNPKVAALEAQVASDAADRARLTHARDEAMVLIGKWRMRAALNEPHPEFKKVGIAQRQCADELEAVLARPQAEAGTAP